MSVSDQLVLVDVGLIVFRANVRGNNDDRSKL